MYEIGDYVFILESVIDRQVETLLQQNKTTSAARWEGYRNSTLQVIAVNSDNTLKLRDPQSHELTISRKACEKAVVG